jgi:multidrug transporter EmrE-like cation transporter
LVILSREELSYAYPMVSLGYLVVVIASFYLFKENVTLLRFAGLLMICLGVSVVARS